MKREPLEDHEKDDILEAASDMAIEYDFTVRALIFTGVRADELAHMKSGWVRWQDEQLRVPRHEDCDCSGCRSKADGSDERTLGDYWRPKTDKGARTIPVKDPDTWRVMREFFKRNDAYGVTRQTVGNRIDKAAERAGLRRNVMPHVLRHTYGTMIAKRGATAQYIRQTMGHEDLSTASEYIHYVGRQLDEEAGKIFGGTD